MNTVRCIYILEREHLLILVNIWLLFIWYICTYAAVMQLCSEPRWHCFWSHVFALIKQLFISFFLSLLQMTISILWVFTMHFHPFSSSDVSLTRSEEKTVGGGGSKKRVMFSCGFWNIPVVLFSWFFSRVFIFSWNMLHTNSRGYDDQSMVCFLAFKLDKSISLTVSYPKSNDVNGVSWLTITVLQLKVYK